MTRSQWGETEDVSRARGATDTNVPPGAMDPKVTLPARLMTPEEQRRAWHDWTIIGGGLVKVDAACIGSDTRSSMEDYWRRRSVISGVDDATRTFTNIFHGRDTATPLDQEMLKPRGFTCGPWTRSGPAPEAIPSPPAALPNVVQRLREWWRVCTGPPGSTAPGMPRPQTPAPPVTTRPIPVRPPTPQTPRPALPTTALPTALRPKLRPGTCHPWAANDVPRPELRAGERFETSADGAQWRICVAGQTVFAPRGAPARPGAMLRSSHHARAAARARSSPYVSPPPTGPLPGTPQPGCTPWRPENEQQPMLEAGQEIQWHTQGAQRFWRVCQTLEAFDTDQVLEWMEGHEALAAQLSMEPPDVWRALLTENPEVLYVWILLGWVEVDDYVRQTFEVLAQELAEIGLSLFDFEAAAREDLPAQVAEELRATPMGLAEMVQAAPMTAAAPVAGNWDAASGVFLPTDSEVWQPASYGYTPQQPRLPQEPQIPAPPVHPEAHLLAMGRPTDRASAANQARIRREAEEMRRAHAAQYGTTVAGVKSTIGSCGCESRPANGRAPAPRIGGPLVLRDTDAGMVVEHAPCATGGARVSGVEEDPRCCPECAIEHLGPTARAWCAGIANRDARIGDVWRDIGMGVAAADRWLSDNVWENVKGVVPGGAVIDAAHQLRMRALEAAAPDFYPSRGTSGAAARAPARAPARLPAKTTARAGAAATSDATDRAIVDATRLAEGVLRGDRIAVAAVKGIKDRAVTGDPEARRRWRVYVLVTTDLHG